MRKANQTFLCAIWNKWARLHFTEMSVRAGASEADGDPNYSRVQYVTWTTLRAASTPAPSLLTSGRLHIYHILTMGGRVGSRKKRLKARATTGNGTQLQWPDLKRKAAKKSHAPMRRKWETPNRPFP